MRSKVVRASSFVASLSRSLTKLIVLLKTTAVLAIVAIIISAIAIALVLTSCSTREDHRDRYLGQVLPDEVQVDLPQIRERDTLKAITTYSATSYFIYRGEPMGWEYELLTRLAEHLDLELQIVVARNLDSMLVMLRRGDGDIIAHGLTVTKERQEVMAFAEDHTTTHQVLVQRKPDNWRQMKKHEIERELIRVPAELIGKPVHVRKGSSYYTRLLALSNEIGGDIDIQIAPGNLVTEDLIAQVAAGEMEYTVADENIAAITRTYHQNLDITTAVSLPQRIAWGLRLSSPTLIDTVSAWISAMKGGADFNVIYNKYFENRRAFVRRLKSEFFSKTGNRISEYDSLIAAHAERLGWDWRLLASMIYQESGFDPTSESWAGAKGLMQLMDKTAKQYGIENRVDPEQSLQAGTDYLDYLYNYYWSEISDSLTRIKFAMASYNVGENHVRDARRLAEKYDSQPDRWEDGVAEFLLKKMQKEYYQDEVVQYGYCRGSEPVAYVDAIFYRYNHYRKVIPK